MDVFNEFATNGLCVKAFPRLLDFDNNSLLFQ